MRDSKGRQGEKKKKTNIKDLSYCTSPPGHGLTDLQGGCSREINYPCELLVWFLEGEVLLGVVTTTQYCWGDPGRDPCSATATARISQGCKSQLPLCRHKPRKVGRLQGRHCLRAYHQTQRRKEVINRPKATCSKLWTQVMLPSLCHTCLGRTAGEFCPSPTHWQVHDYTGPKLRYWSCMWALKFKKFQSFAPANLSWTSSLPELSTLLLLQALKHKLSDSLAFGLF